MHIFLFLCADRYYAHNNINSEHIDANRVGKI